MKIKLSIKELFNANLIIVLVIKERLSRLS